MLVGSIRKGMSRVGPWRFSPVLLLSRGPKTRSADAKGWAAGAKGVSRARMPDGWRRIYGGGFSTETAGQSLCSNRTGMLMRSSRIGWPGRAMEAAETGMPLRSIRNGGQGWANGGLQVEKGGFRRAKGGFRRANGGFRRANGGFARSNGWIGRAIYGGGFSTESVRIRSARSPLAKSVSTPKTRLSG